LDAAAHVGDLPVREGVADVGGDGARDREREPVRVRVPETGGDGHVTSRPGDEDRCDERQRGGDDHQHHDVVCLVVAVVCQHQAQVTDLDKAVWLLSCDQQTMMLLAGTGRRADQTATVQRVAHELFTDPAVGRLLDELRPLEDSLEPDSDDAALIGLTRRDYEKAVNVPSALRAAMARATAEARPVWVKAKAEADFPSFLPALERIVELKLEYV